MKFYDWLEGVSEEIDRSLETNVLNPWRYLPMLDCILVMILLLIPTKRAFFLSGMIWDASCSKESHESAEFNGELYDNCHTTIYMAVTKEEHAWYIKFYNEYKYWWMPSK